MEIYKLLTAPQWEELQRNGSFAGAPVDFSDGYIHMSTAKQVRETAARHFSGVEGLVIAAFDAESFGQALRWEPSRGGELFPHIYGQPLDGKDVIWSQSLALDEGSHRFPDFPA